MKAALILMEHDYGDSTRGHSYEYINIYLPVTKILGKENVALFDFFAEFKKSGKEMMNRRLEDFITAEKPDFALFCLFEDEFDENMLNRLKDKTKTTAYFFDDPWRRGYADYWRKFFHFSTTPDYYIYLGYKSEGRNNIIHSPFGYNSEIYKKLDNTEKIYDVTFVGGYSPYRRWVINLLKKQGVNVAAFGRDWGSKWITQDEMVRIFNQSRISLNLSNSISHDYRFLLSTRSFKDIKQLMVLKKNKEQLKGRHYEINGCGGFQLSYFVPGLNLAYEIDREIAVYEDIGSLADEIKFFLNNNDLRDSIARAGYARSVRDHTAEGYMRKLIQQIS